MGEKMGADDRIFDTERGFESRCVDSPSSLTHAGPIMGACT